MPERTSYAQGIPSWVDLASPDVAASKAFYGALFGWDAKAPGSQEETGGYHIFTLRGKNVAGVAPIMNPEHPPSWSTYIAVDDAEEIAAKVPDAGGQVAVAPMDIADAGRMAFFVDATGAFVGVWQARAHTGAELVNEPGTVGWNELITRDADAAKLFYTEVFGIAAKPWEGQGGMPYTVWEVDGQTVGGLLEMDDEHFPPDMSPHWMTYFIAGDADATVTTTTELGGEVRVAPFDVPGIGRIAVLADPHGAGFSIMQPAQPDE